MTTALLKDHMVVPDKVKTKKDQVTELATTANNPDTFPAIVPLKENPDTAMTLLKDHMVVPETVVNKEKAVTTMVVTRKENTPIPTLQSPVTIATRLATFQETVRKKENQDKTTLKAGNALTRNMTTTTTTTTNLKATLVTNVVVKVTFQETVLREFSVSSANKVVTSLMNARQRERPLIKN